MSIYQGYIIPHLLADDEFRKRCPLRSRHFNKDDQCGIDAALHAIFRCFEEYKHSGVMSPELLGTVLSGVKGLSQHASDGAVDFIGNLPKDPPVVEMGWLNERVHEQYLERQVKSLVHNTIGAWDRWNMKALADIGLEINRIALANSQQLTFQESSKMNLESLFSNFTPPTYLVEGVFRNGWLYGLTGLTGSGKTAVALAIAMAVERGTPIGKHRVRKGRVVYFAGENPDDVTGRIAGMIEGEDLSNFQMTVVPYATREKANRAVDELIKENLPIDLVIIDTSAAYFLGEKEDDNIQALEHAKWMRDLTNRLPGNPTVLVCCHPVKRAESDDLIPRGGSAFLNELDGNLSCESRGDFSIIQPCGKYRETRLNPIAFRRFEKRPKILSGMPTVVGEVSSDEDYKRHTTVLKENDKKVLSILAKDRTRTLASIADELLWILPAGAPNKVKAKRSIDRLKKDRLVDADNAVTALGKELLGIECDIET